MLGKWIKKLLTQVVQEVLEKRAGQITYIIDQRVVKILHKNIIYEKRIADIYQEFAKRQMHHRP